MFKPYFYIDELEVSNKRFAILPALGASKHFNAVVLVKEQVAGLLLNSKRRIIPIIIEPTSGNTDLASITNETRALLLKAGTGQPIIHNLGIQQDGCSCGPLAMMAATDLAVLLRVKNIQTEDLGDRVPAIFKTLTRDRESYEEVDLHPRARVKILYALD